MASRRYDGSDVEADRSTPLERTPNCISGPFGDNSIEYILLARRANEMLSAATRIIDQFGGTEKWKRCLEDLDRQKLPSSSASIGLKVPPSHRVGLPKIRCRPASSRPLRANLNFVS